MSKTIKKSIDKKAPAAEKSSREELMKTPGWSNTKPGSPAATPVQKRSEVLPSQITK